ncbi:hypothetical protein KQX54_002376 [Cotesia glomerata]|uniref:Uncharacterized protein n=1 Tax=Cotesia glomerata TaxID=32391 RepID=A0AAV7I671_COTGL|nr:hypothetical protein KQX54_002376 [Cotesia glomerata]
MNRATNGNRSSPEPSIYLCIFIILSSVQSWGYDKYMDRGIWCVAIDGNAPSSLNSSTRIDALVSRVGFHWLYASPLGLSRALFYTVQPGRGGSNKGGFKLRLSALNPGSPSFEFLRLDENIHRHSTRGLTHLPSDILPDPQISNSRIKSSSQAVEYLCPLKD